MEFKHHFKKCKILSAGHPPLVYQIFLNEGFPNTKQTETDELFEKLDPYKKQINFILVMMIIMAGGPQVVLMFPTKFSSVVIICSALTIIIPLMISCTHLAINNPVIVFNSNGRSSNIKFLAMRIGVLILSVLNPSHH